MTRIGNLLPQVPYFFIKVNAMREKILIAGIGNLLFTDEGIGVHVIRELEKRHLPENIELVEIGTATFELTGRMEGKDKVIIVDALLSDDPPGTVFRLTPADLSTEDGKFSASLHQYGVAEALRTAAMTGNTPEVVILGIVPKDHQSLGTELTDELKRDLLKIVQAVLKETA
jgi:hydrogenase maturation protease